MSDIQRARDVLAKWRDGATLGPWAAQPFSDEPGDEGVSILGDCSDAMREHMIGYILPTFSPRERVEADARLIVGTAGNPDLLDAIDYMLAIEQDRQLTSFAPVMPNLQLERIAAAIIAADERMSA